MERAPSASSAAARRQGRLAATRSCSRCLWRICRRRPRGLGLFSRGSRSRSRPGSWERWVHNAPARPCPGRTLPWESPSRRASPSPVSWIRSTLSWPFLGMFPQRINLLVRAGLTPGGDRATGKNSPARPLGAMHIVRQVQDGQPLLSVARQIASTAAPSPRFSSADPASKREKRSRLRQSFLLRRAFLQGCGERRIARSAVDEFGGGAQCDHHASRRVANRVLAFGAHLERAFRLRRAIDLTDGGRQNDPLRHSTIAAWANLSTGCR